MASFITGLVLYLIFAVAWLVFHVDFELLVLGILSLIYAEVVGMKK